MTKRILICSLALIVFSNTLLAQQLSIITLKNRQAEELLPTIRPLLTQDEGISGKGYEIYLNAGPETTQSIRALLSRLDKSPAQLLISFKNLAVEANSQSGISISGSIDRNNAQITNNDKLDTKSVTITSSTSSSLTSTRKQPQIRATEGKPALIFVGSSVPVTITDRQYLGGRLIEREVADFQPVQRGIYVTAWLNGDKIRLEISQNNNSLQNDNALNISGFKTQAHGRLGEWIPIAGTGTQQHSSSSNITDNSTISTHSRNDVFIMVEKLD